METAQRSRKNQGSTLQHKEDALYAAYGYTVSVLQTSSNGCKSGLCGDKQLVLHSSNSEATFISQDMFQLLFAIGDTELVNAYRAKMHDRLVAEERDGDTHDLPRGSWLASEPDARDVAEQSRLPVAQGKKPCDDAIEQRRQRAWRNFERNLRRYATDSARRDETVESMAWSFTANGTKPRSSGQRQP